MNRQRVLLLEDDGTIQGVLCDLFEDEGLDVTLCGSLAELQAGVRQYPRAAVVCDSWATGDYQDLSPHHRAEIVALAKTTPVILTTGRVWARYSCKEELGTEEILEKPYDLGQLMAAVQAALKRAEGRPMLQSCQLAGAPKNNQGPTRRLCLTFDWTKKLPTNQTSLLDRIAAVSSVVRWVQRSLPRSAGAVVEVLDTSGGRERRSDPRNAKWA